MPKNEKSADLFRNPKVRKRQPGLPALSGGPEPPNNQSDPFGCQARIKRNSQFSCVQTFPQGSKFHGRQALRLSAVPPPAPVHLIFESLPAVHIPNLQLPGESDEQGYHCPCIGISLQESHVWCRPARPLMLPPTVVGLDDIRGYLLVPCL
jgi:hypothetical protein